MALEWKKNIEHLAAREGRQGFDVLDTSTTATLTPTAGTEWVRLKMIGTAVKMKASPATGDYFSTDGAATGGQIKIKGARTDHIDGRFTAVTLAALTTPGTGNPFILAYRDQN